MDLGLVPPPGSGRGKAEAGTLTYDITCAQNPVSCTTCRDLEAGLGAASLIPAIGFIFGLGNVGITAACQAQGC